MASKCSTCKQLKNTPSPPSVWCQTCDKLLCESCEGTHKLSQGTKNHNTIPFEEYQKLPQIILNTNINCDDHEHKLVYFCRVHDQPLCVTCRRNSHKNCKYVPKIEDVVSNVKDSAVFENIITEMEAMCGTLQAIAQDREDNLNQLRTNQSEAISQFKRKYEEIINPLKKLKKKTISKINDTHAELTNDLSNTLQIVQSKERKLREILNQKDDIIKFASNYHTFIGIKKIYKKNMIHETNVNIQELLESKKLDKYNYNYIKFDINETIEDLVCGIQSLGDVIVTKSPSAVGTHVTRPRAAQMEVPKLAPVKLQLKQMIDLDQNGSYFDCCTLPYSGHLIFADSGDDNSTNSRVCIYRTDKTHKSTINFNKETEKVFNVTSVDDHHVAVSHPVSGTISIIDVDKGIFNKGKVIKTLKIGEGVAGISCKGRDVLCVRYDDLVKVNIDSGKVRAVHEVKDGDAYFIHVSNDLICYTCLGTNTVTLLDTQYNVICTYKDESVLDGPTGVTMDEQNNIYVTGSNSNNLVVISPNGKSCHQLLGENDGLKKPTAVHYDSSTKKLVVINKRGPAYIYSC